MSNASTVSLKKPITPVPDDAPEMDYVHPKYKEPSGVWPYRSAQGDILMYTVRFDHADKRGNPAKTIYPITFCDLGNGRQGWRAAMLPEPRPLYGLDSLAARPEAPVLVCEGEKAADAGSKMFAEYVVVTSSGGAGSAHKSDWTPLAGRRVTVWPDADDPGRHYATQAARLALKAGANAAVVVEVPEQFPEGWDLADSPPEGWDDVRLRQLIEAAEPVSVEEPQDAKSSGDLLTDSTGSAEVLEVVAETRDADGNSWGKLLRWKDPDGREHEWAMPLWLLGGDGSEVRARLLDGGLYLASGRKEREELMDYLGSARVAARARCVTHTGWHTTPTGPVFVLSDEAFGNAGPERVILQSSSRAEPKFRPSGSLPEWQSEIATHCVGNTRLVFAVSAAFAAPLLNLTNSESGGFHFRGSSSIGKTTALHVGGSVWGGGNLRGYATSWRATDNGLEAVALEHCDVLLCLDELSQVDPRSAGEVAYMLSNGSGKHRAGRTGEARKPAQWRVLFLSTGEISLADKLREGGRRPATAGQEVRVLDIPADPGADLGLFEALHLFKNGSTFADFLRDVTQRFYGTAGREFLRVLNKDALDRDNLTASANQIRADFVKANVPSGADGQVSRAASRFGLVAAAGELAAMTGIVPWPKGEATKAAVICFQAWLEARGGTEPAEIREGIAAVRAFLETYGSSRFEEWNDANRCANNRAGFRRKDKEHRWEYYILPEAWRNDVCAGRDAKALARILADKKLLQPGSNKKLSRSLEVPTLGKTRVYHILASILADDEVEGSEDSKVAALAAVEGSTS